MPKIEQTIADVNVRSHTFRFITPWVELSARLRCNQDSRASALAAGPSGPPDLVEHTLAVLTRVFYREAS